MGVVVKHRPRPYVRVEGGTTLGVEGGVEVLLGRVELDVLYGYETRGEDEVLGLLGLWGGGSRGLVKPQGGGKPPAPILFLPSHLGPAE